MATKKRGKPPDDPAESVTQTEGDASETNGTGQSIGDTNGDTPARLKPQPHHHVDGVV